MGKNFSVEETKAMASNLKALSDTELLAQYTEGGSQEALAEIVDRYTDLVYAVCQRTLGDAQAAEDAAQAAFLVLAREAAAYRRHRLFPPGFT